MPLIALNKVDEISEVLMAAGFTQYNSVRGSEMAGFAVNPSFGVVLSDDRGFDAISPVKIAPRVITVEWCALYGQANNQAEFLNKYFLALNDAGYKCRIGNQCVVVFCA